MESNRKIAALDIGSNSIMLLLVSYRKSGQIKVLDEFGGITKLGEGLKSSNSLTPAATHRTVELCNEIIEIANGEGAEKIIVTASSVIRNAINKTEFLVACHSRFNIFPQVLTSAEEGNYIFNGATYGFDNIEGDIVVLEVGGNKVNITFGTKDMLVGSYSLDLGFMHLPEKPGSKKHFFSETPKSLKKYIKKSSATPMQEIKSWLGNRKPTIICCGGTATALASIYSGQNYRDRHQINKMSCLISKVKAIARRLGKMSFEDRKILLGLEHQRAKFIYSSIYTMYHLLKQLGNTDQFYITTNGLRTGVLKEYIKKSNSIL